MEEKKQGKKLNVPNLRFPEFTGEWENKTFKDVCRITTGNKNTQDKKDNGRFPFYVRSQNIEKIDDYTFDGEAILTAGDGVGVGKVFHYSTSKIGVHQRVYILSDFKCDSKFLFYFFSSRFYNRVKKMSAKNSVDSVRMEMIADMPLNLPNYSEQQKIGKLLSLIDERITTQSKIIEDLEKLKSAIYHRVFSAMKGKTVALKSVVNIIKGKQLNGTELSDNGDYYVMNGGIVPSGYYHAYNAPANTISISEGGNSCGYVQFNHLPFWSGGHCYTLQMSSTDINLRFLYHFLKHKEKDIMALRIGSGLPNIQKKDLGDFPIQLPTINQQEKAVGLFDALLQKVNVETKLHNHLITQKQYLLRQIFI